MSNSLNLALPYLEAAQAQKHVTMNEALRRLDAVVQLAVEDRTLSFPPPAPNEGDRYIVAGGAGGAWAGHALDVAAYVDGAWVFFAARAGWIAFVKAEGAILYFTGAAWEILVSAGDYETVGRFGINGTGDSVNRLVVQAEAALFAPDPTLGVPTGDARIKVTKTGPGDVASHIFQTNYSGRAEFGLIGSDDFSLKVSPDGSTFAEAFTVDRHSARVDFTRPPVVGDAVAVSLEVPSRAALAAAAVPAEVTILETLGFAAAGDGGGARYRRVASAPVHAGKVQSADGAWWELDEALLFPEMFGAVGGKAVAPGNDAAILNVLSVGRPVCFRSMYRVTSQIVVADHLSLKGVPDRLVGLFWPSDAASVGLVVRPQSLGGEITTIENLRFERQGIGGTALTLDLSQQGDWSSPAIDGLSQRGFIRRNAVQGTNPNVDAFAIGIHLVQGFKVILEENYIRGARTLATKTYHTTHGILVEPGVDSFGNKLNYTISVDCYRNTVLFAEHGIVYYDQEGCNIDENDLQGVVYGIWLEQTFRIKNQFRIETNHISFYKTAIHCHHCDHIKLLGNECAFAADFPSWFWNPAVGEDFVRIEACRYVVVTGNTIRNRISAGDDQLEIRGITLSAAPLMGNPSTMHAPSGILIDENVFLFTRTAINNLAWSPSIRWYTVPNAPIRIGDNNHYQNVSIRAANAPAENAAVHPTVTVGPDQVVSLTAPTDGLLIVRGNWQACGMVSFNTSAGTAQLIAGSSNFGVVTSLAQPLAIAGLPDNRVTVAAHGGVLYVANTLSGTVNIRYILM